MKGKQASTNWFFRTTLKDDRLAAGPMKMRGAEGRQNLETLRKNYEALLKQEREHEIAARMGHINATVPRGPQYEAAVKAMMVDLLKEEQDKIDVVAQKDDATRFFDTRFKKIWHDPKVAKKRLIGGLAIAGASFITGGAAGGIALAGILAFRVVGGFMAGEVSLERYSAKWGHKGETDKIYKRAVDGKEAKRLANLERSTMLTATELAERDALRTKIADGIKQEVEKYNRADVQKEIARLQMLQGEKRTALKNAGRAGGKTAMVIEALMQRDAELTAKEIVEGRNRRTPQNQLAGLMSERLKNETEARNQQIETEVDRERKNKLKRKVAAGVLAVGFTAGSFAVQHHFHAQAAASKKPEGLDYSADHTPPASGGGGVGGGGHAGGGAASAAETARGATAGGKAAVESLEKGHYVCTQEGGSAWTASKELQHQLGWSDKEWAQAWSESTATVDGKTVRISDLSLIHEGDKFTAIDTANGPRIIFESASGLKAGDNQALLEALVREKRAVPEWLAHKTGYHPAGAANAAEHVSPPTGASTAATPEAMPQGTGASGAAAEAGGTNVPEHLPSGAGSEDYIRSLRPGSAMFEAEVNTRVHDSIQNIYGERALSSPEWNAWSKYTAGEFLRTSKNSFPEGSARFRLYEYMQELIDDTRMHPRFGFFRKETIEEFIKRAEAHRLIMVMRGIRSTK